MNADYDLDIKSAAYEWSVRLFTMVRKLLRVNVKMHHDEGQIGAGDIFLFNHFSRFETFIPQYLIFKQTGVYCRSVADKALFLAGDSFSSYLLSLGAVPNNYRRLLPFLAEEILRGRKVIIFPEGGMVKDRLVQDETGRYQVYSRTAEAWRTHHRGAAVLAVVLDIFKKMIREAYIAGEMQRLQRWADALHLESVEALLINASKPTQIIPANITFYPIRVNDNILRKGAEILNKGLSRRASEELLIEGNILLRDTDMDIRLGSAIIASGGQHWWQRKLIARVGRQLDKLDDLFCLRPPRVGWDGQLLARTMSRRASQIRDEFMHRIYQGVTVNLSHLASWVIMAFVKRGLTEIDEDRFRRAVYLTVKGVQREPSVHLHRSLRNPELYASLMAERCEGLQQFLATLAAMGLVERGSRCYCLSPKLLEHHDLDAIRLRNLVAVYVNEVKPVAGVGRCAEAAVTQSQELDRRALARMCFDDELLAFAWDRSYFRKARYLEINQLETATESAEPFLRIPNPALGVGVVLVHGFLASPAEMRRFGEKLAVAGYPVVGVRLKGHGTSPWDLRGRTWLEWLESLRQGFSVMSGFVDHIVVVGFSAGGTLALKLAAEQPDGLVGMAVVSAPVLFRNRNMRFVPLVHGANEFLRLVSPGEGVMSFRPNEPENPQINYRSIPIQGLYELRHLVDEVRATLANVHCDALVIQGTEDPVVDPGSAEIILDGLGSKNKTLKTVVSTQHAILFKDIGGTQEMIQSFLHQLASETRPRRPSRMEPAAVSI